MPNADFLPPLTAPTREQLMQRRQQLRQQRRHRTLQGTWRVVSTVVLLGGLVQGIRQPYWQLQQANQIEIEGNQWLTDQQIRAQLPLSFPINVWQVQPQQIQQALLNQPEEDPWQASPIRQVSVRRQLFPPLVSLQIEERQPLARSQVKGVMGLVDGEGLWLSLKNYPTLAASRDLPSLTLLGWELHPPQQWASLLAALQTSSVKVEAVDWQSTEALYLLTELGKVYLGSLTPQLPQQLQALAQMRDLQRYCQCDPRDIDYIDLSSPTVPTIQLTPQAAAQRWGEPSP
ncbi:MAG: FtsQ-type POTRA domain-containing protein [Cyanobacteriota bacterium]|nr:FtsQ-type POTRA domain-containing protein [Cyanobacteriota bacterium]